jgi:SAM-dependent methyltransferase
MLGAVPAGRRDAWLDLVLGLDDHYDDGPDLPAGGVPYLPCAVDVLLRAIDAAAVGASDVVVDIGAGPGRAVALVHLLTGAGAVGIEIQSALVRVAREMTARLGLARAPTIHGDAAELAGFMTSASVFLLYCPFSGARLFRVLDHIEAIARTRRVRICCVGMTLPERAWLKRQRGEDAEFEIYRSTPIPADVAGPSEGGRR